MSKEWWIDDVTQRVCAPIDHSEFGLQTMLWPDNEKVIRVIEKSAYDALLAQTEKLAKQLDHQRSEWLCEVLEREECAGTSHGTYLMENVYSAEKSLAAWQQFKEQK